MEDCRIAPEMFELPSPALSVHGDGQNAVVHECRRRCARRALEAGGVSHHCWSTKGEGLERKSQTATRTTVTLLNRSKDPKQGKLATISGPEVEERGGGALSNGETVTLLNGSKVRATAWYSSPVPLSSKLGTYKLVKA